MSCSGPGDCTAVGEMTTDIGPSPASAMYAVESDWIWGPLTVVATPTNDGQLFGVSCTDATDCTAVGEDDNGPVYAMESGGVWGTAVDLPVPGGSGVFNSVSCTSTTDCTAVGTESVNPPIMYARELNGTWGPITGIPNGASAMSVSCVSALDCTAVGVGNGPDGIQPTYRTESDGVWAPEVYLTAADPGEAEFEAVSCTAVGNCTAVGVGYGGAMEATESGGVWGPVADVAAPDAGDRFFAVSCVSATACTAVGDGVGGPVPVYSTSSATSTPLTISVTGSQTYGSASASFSTTDSAPAGDTLSGTLTCASVAGPTTTITPSLAAGTYTIDGATCSGLTLSGPTAADYDLSYAGTFTVNKAPLVVTANNQTRTVLTANPALTYSISGLVNGDTAAGALTGKPTLSTTATTTSLPGSYPISIARGSLAAANYTFTFVAGTLTVTAVANTGLGAVVNGVVSTVLALLKTLGL